MDSAPAIVHTPVRETEIGELGPLARAAMLRRMDSAQARQRAQALLPQEVEARARAPRTDQREQRAPSAAPADPRASLGSEEQIRPFQVTTLFPYQRVPRDRRTSASPDNPDGHARRELHAVQAELSSLRAEIASLSRLVGRPLPAATAVQSAAQQSVAPSADARATAYQQAQAQYRVRTADAAERSAQQDRALSRLMRERELARIEQRQQELLRALRRAEQRLAQAPADLPTGLRDGLIGEIYRARYNIALFGGTYGGPPAGLAFDLAV